MKDNGKIVKYDGYGIMYLSDGSIYNGYWKEGEKDKFGLNYVKDSEYYVGQYKSGNYEGYGKMNFIKIKNNLKGYLRIIF